MPVSLHDRAFSACADGTRRRILSLLRDGEVCVGDLVTVLQAPQPTVSRHLAWLRRARLVDVARDGNWIFYRLMPPASDFHSRLLDCVSCSAGEDPVMRRDARRLARLREGGGCCVRSSDAPRAAKRRQSQAGAE